MENFEFFTKSECDKILNLSNILEKHVRDESPRSISYDFYSIGWNENTKWIFDKLDLYFTKKTGIKVVKQLDAIHLFDYSVGDKFTRHRDVYYPGQVWNIGVCLNDDYEGGDFVLYNPNKTIPKKTGQIYTFECKQEHEVLEVKKGNRWSLIGFYFYEHLDLKPSLL